VYILLQVIYPDLYLMSGRVCVPIDAENPEAFNPLAVPTVTELLNDIDSWQKSHSEDSSKARLSDWEKTSLKPYVTYFRHHVDLMMSEERNSRKRQSAELGGMATADKMLDF
jgi:DNA primase small subunit